MVEFNGIYLLGISNGIKGGPIDSMWKLWSRKLSTFLDQQLVGSDKIQVSIEK